jgi:hypothetical protein
LIQIKAAEGFGRQHQLRIAEEPMTTGEALYLAMVVVAAVVFAGTLAWVSWRDG